MIAGSSSSTLTCVLNFLFLVYLDQLNLERLDLLRVLGLVNLGDSRLAVCLVMPINTLLGIEVHLSISCHRLLSHLLGNELEGHFHFELLLGCPICIHLILGFCFTICFTLRGLVSFRFFEEDQIEAL